jgi:hypothetical protein
MQYQTTYPQLAAIIFLRLKQFAPQHQTINEEKPRSTSQGFGVLSGT